MAIDEDKATDLSVAPVVGPDDPRRFTDSGIEVKPLYTADDVADGLEGRLGEPGSYPFTRGPAAALRARRRGAGRRPRKAARHRPERHPQEIHRARKLHLPAPAVDAA